MLRLNGFKGRNCLVVGSAPGVVLPRDKPVDVVIGANGGAALVPRCDVLCTTAYLFKKATEVDREILGVMRGLRVQTVVVDTKDGGMDLVRLGCREGNIACQTFREVPPADRDEVVFHVTGKHLGSGAERVSTGVFAACLALVSGVHSVVIAGIGLSNGHVGSKLHHVRHHGAADYEVLRVLANLRKVSTTSSALMELGVRNA